MQYKMAAASARWSARSARIRHNGGYVCRGTTQLSNATEIAGNRLRVSVLQHRDNKNHVQMDTFGAISRVRSTRPECARWIAHAAK